MAQMLLHCLVLFPERSHDYIVICWLKIEVWINCSSEFPPERPFSLAVIVFRPCVKQPTPEGTPDQGSQLIG